MTTAEQIKVLCVRSNISVAELARRIGQTSQNLNAKLKRNTVSDNEIRKICQILDVDYKSFFILANGEI
ncbi:MAG TPA: helix-turn-helix transcriptional regulator, partial [Oscillospiraceae bacterium]|nr:helix-turn-helix transcriptional regulator [Oscillospiraceae bacterium]